MRVTLRPITTLVLFLACAVPSVASADMVDLDHQTRWSSERTAESRVAMGPGIHLVAHPQPTLDELDAAGRAFLDRHPTLFGVGAAEVTHLHGQAIGERHAIVSYEQTEGGLRVLGTRVNLIFRGPVLVVASSTAAVLPRRGDFALDAALARAAVVTALGADTRVLREERALVSHDGALRPVWHFIAATDRPIGLFDLAVDAETGAIIRKNDLMADVVQVEASVAPPQLGAARAPLAFPYWNPTAGPDGRADAPAGSLSVGMSGPLAVVSDDVAAVGSATFTVAGTGGLEALAWPATGTPQEQLDAWVWSHVAIEHGRQLAPDLLWLQQPMGIHVNFDDGSGFPYCNAFYMADLPEAPNPGDIHFFRAGGNAEAQCINTATVPHVVMHEWGHGFHDHLNPNRAYDDTDRSISEGIGDYISATVLDDPIMPVNAIFTPESPFQAEPRLVENTFVYPGDLQGQVHWDGQIWAGTWWDVRKGMRARYGEVVGTRMADDLHTRAVRGAPVWTTAYAVTIGLDDDDDDPSNGTPHSCEINAAFAAHGLAAATPVPSRGSLRFTHTPAASAIEGDQTIALAVQTAAGCGDLDPASVSVTYQIGAAPAVTLPMTAAASGFEAVVPALVAGDIVTYRFTARATDGAEASWPAGGGQYALVVDGGDEPLIAWDFEDGGMGWTTGGSSPIANDWQFGAPAGKAGDPARAGGGAVSAGTDLGVVSNGAYEPTASTTWLATPAVECGGACSELRVRFRRHLSLAAGDSARVKVGDQVIWEVTGPLQDPDWTWQEVALTAVTATESIQIGFELQSDGTAEAGGWNLDDVALFKPPGSDDDGASGGCGCGAGGGSSGAMALILLAISLAFAPGRGRGRRSRSSSRR